MGRAIQDGERYDHDWREALAAEVERLSCETESLGAALCDDAVLIDRHLVRIQQVDRIAQLLASVAGLLRASDIAQALDLCPNRELVERIGDRARAAA